METVYYLIQKMLPVAIPLLLVALGGMFSERSGVINIALVGIMLFGAYFGVLFIYFTQGTAVNPQVLFLIGMIVAMVAGLIYSLFTCICRHQYEGPTSHRRYGTQYVYSSDYLTIF